MEKNVNSQFLLCGHFLGKRNEHVFSYAQVTNFSNFSDTDYLKQTKSVPTILSNKG